MRFLQAYASLTDNEPSLTISILKLETNSYDISTQDVYILPKDNSRLQNSSDLYFNSADPILNINKKDYNEKIVFDFINLNKNDLDYDNINLRYRTVLSSLVSGDVPALRS